MARKSAIPAPEVSAELLGLLRACKDEPDDDAPLLVLADWLEERNGRTDADRAALVRQCCEMSRVEKHSPRWSQLHNVTDKLCQRHRDDWFGPFGYSGHFERGLLHVRPAVTTFLSRQMKDWMRTEAGAWVTAVSLQQFKAGHVKRLASHPGLPLLSEIDFFFGEREDVGLAGLLASPNLTGLRKLSTMHVAVLDAGLTALAGWPGLAGLTALSLCGAGLTDAAAAVLASSPLSSNLRRLGLHDNTIHDEGVIALATSPYLSNVREMFLVTNPITDVGAEAILASPHLAGLRRLTISTRGFRPDVVEALRQRFPGDYLRA